MDNKLLLDVLESVCKEAQKQADRGNGSDKRYCFTDGMVCAFEVVLAKINALRDVIE